MCIQNLVIFCQFFLKILRKNEIMASIKGSYSVTNVQKMTGNNPNEDFVNINVSILSQDTEKKRNSGINQRL